MYLSVRMFLIAIVLLLANISLAASDLQWTFQINSTFNYTLSSASSPQVFAGNLPADDPTLNLILGRRYGVTVTDISHPLQIIAVAGGADTVLLAQGATGGLLESDASIQWVDSGTGLVEFTASASLFNALTQGGATPGYRCEVHPTDMRGTFALFGNGTPIANPIPATIQKGSIQISLDPVMSGLTSPVGLTQPDDGTNRLFITDQVGRVRIVENGTPLGTPFLDVAGRLVALNAGGDERGLLGFAMHPNFTTNPKVYTYTSEPDSGAATFTFPGGATPNHQSVIAEWQVSTGNPNVVNTGSRRELLRIDQPQSNHNGGAMHFGADGMLYIALGDGGSGDDTGNGHSAQGNGQDITNIYGSILRINVDGSNSSNGQYGIPAGNPFVGAAGVDEIFAYGLRNPYSFSVDLANGDLYVGDVGQGKIEEIDKVTLGGNYGWRLKEGSFFFDPNGASGGFVTDIPVEPVPANLIDPIVQYDHDEGVSVIMGSLYRGAGMPGLVGSLVFGDFRDGSSGRLFYSQSGGLIQEFRIGPSDQPLNGVLKGFGQDRNGELYACVSGQTGPSGTTGVVYRLVQLAGADLQWTKYE